MKIVITSWKGLKETRILRGIGVQRVGGKRPVCHGCRAERKKMFRIYLKESFHPGPEFGRAASFSGFLPAYFYLRRGPLDCSGIGRDQNDEPKSDAVPCENGEIVMADKAQQSPHCQERTDERSNKTHHE